MKFRQAKCHRLVKNMSFVSGGLGNTRVTGENSGTFCLVDARQGNLCRRSCRYLKGPSSGLRPARLKSGACSRLRCRGNLAPDLHPGKYL